MENFDLKKFLIENKLTTDSKKLSEADIFNSFGRPGHEGPGNNDLILPDDFLDSFDEVTDDFLRKHGLIEYIGEWGEVDGWELLGELKKKGMPGSKIGWVKSLSYNDVDNQGAEWFQVFDLGKGYIATIDDYEDVLHVHRVYGPAINLHKSLQTLKKHNLNEVSKAQFYIRGV